MRRLYPTLALLLLASACTKDAVETPDAAADGYLAGGEGTIFSQGPDAYTFPLANLDAAGVEQHFLADGAFGQQFVSAPAPKFGGVGPLFNQNACESCHVRNGRGIVPQFDGDPATGLLLRLSLNGDIDPEFGGRAVPGYGTQLQTKGVFGVTVEGKLAKTETLERFRYADGSGVELSRPRYTIGDPYAPLPADVRISPRLAPAVHGLGLLEAIREADILALADAEDHNRDGISGRPNQVWDVLAKAPRLGRFGWKAEQPTAAQQAADAAHNDMGLTNFYFPEEHCDGQENCVDFRQNDNDLDRETIELLAFYFQTVAVPARRDLTKAIVRQGQQIFAQLNCGSCHHPEFTTGSHEIQALAQQRIFPYTDLLLHDMGPGLADDRPTFAAGGQEWRTAPLWGVGLAQVVNPKATFLHDGRAKTLEEAILWHGGEAETSKQAFAKLSAGERTALIDFVSSL